MIYFVLDTNVLLSEGKQALYQFEDGHVVVPTVVLNELNSKKTDSELGYVARSVLKEIDHIFTDVTSRISAPLGEGFGKLIIEEPLTDMRYTGFIPATTDGDIIRTAENIRIITDEGDEVVIVTKDIQFSILARINGYETRDLEVKERSEVIKHIRSVETFYITDEEMSYLYKDGTVRLDINVPRNIGVVLKSHSGGSALAISDTQWKFNLISNDKSGSLQGRNAEQSIALGVLSDANVGVVSLCGPAGSGKSYMALATAYGLAKNSESPIDKVIVYRPINAVGGSQQELGFLPGTVDEKMAPHVEAVQDTLEAFAGKIDAGKALKDGTVKVDSVSFVRGRTISNTAIIVEEAQNLEYATLLTLLTRAGANSRVFLVWDMSQRDNQYIKKNDGVHRVVNKLLGHKLFAHVPFSKSERSAISAMAVDLLDEL